MRDKELLKEAFSPGGVFANFREPYLSSNSDKRESGCTRFVYACVSAPRSNSPDISALCQRRGESTRELAGISMILLLVFYDTFTAEICSEHPEKVFGRPYIIL